MVHWKSPESSTWNSESTARNPESKTVLDSLTWGGKFFTEGYSLVKGALSLNSAKDKDLSLVSHRRPCTSAIKPRLHSISVFFFLESVYYHHPRFHALLYNYLLERLRVINWRFWYLKQKIKSNIGSEFQIQWKERTLILLDLLLVFLGFAIKLIFLVSTFQHLNTESS